MHTISKHTSKSVQPLQLPQDNALLRQLVVTGRNAQCIFLVVISDNAPFIPLALGVPKPSVPPILSEVDMQQVEVPMIPNIHNCEFVATMITVETMITHTPWKIHQGMCYDGL